MTFLKSLILIYCFSYWSVNQPLGSTHKIRYQRNKVLKPNETALMRTRDADRDEKVVALDGDQQLVNNSEKTSTQL